MPKHCSRAAGAVWTRKRSSSWPRTVWAPIGSCAFERRVARASRVFVGKYDEESAATEDADGDLIGAGEETASIDADAEATPLDEGAIRDLLGADEEDPDPESK